MDNLSAGDYAPHVNSKFRLVDSDGLELELVGVDAQTHLPRQEMFALTFRGPAEPFLEQGVYRLAHDALGAGALFLVPIGRDADGGFRYEASFNRLID